MKPKFKLENYNDKCVMHCDTEEKAKKFCKFLHDNGRKWWCNYSYLEDTGWKFHKNETCYAFNTGYFSSMSFYKWKRYTILEFDDFDWEEKHMFKVGDKVRVKENLEANRMYGNAWFDEGMKQYCGKIYEISAVMANTIYRLKDKDEHSYIKINDWGFSAEMLEPVKTDSNCSTQKIVITSDGVTTTAKLYDNKQIVKSATAKCSPDDKFDLMTGAKIAFNRLNETVKFNKPHLESTFFHTVKLYGNIGELTNHTAIFGENLYVGDVVEIYDTKLNISLGENFVCKDEEKAFIMSLKICDFENGICGCWQIRKVRSYKDLKDGEIINDVKAVLKGRKE